MISLLQVYAYVVAIAFIQRHAHHMLPVAPTLYKHAAVTSANLSAGMRKTVLHATCTARSAKLYQASPPGLVLDRNG